VLNFVNLIAAAGNETTTRLIGWIGKVLAEHPDQRREIVARRDLVPAAIEEICASSHRPGSSRYVNKDVEHHGQLVRQAAPSCSSTGRATATTADSRTAITSTSTPRSITTRFATHPLLPRRRARSLKARGPGGGARAIPHVEIDWDNAKQARTSTVRAGSASRW